jgi:hypothetical protein
MDPARHAEAIALAEAHEIAAGRNLAVDLSSVLKVSGPETRPR